MLQLSTRLAFDFSVPYFGLSNVAAWDRDCLARNCWFLTDIISDHELTNVSIQGQFR
jgi:hypothetical protein